MLRDLALSIKCFLFGSSIHEVIQGKLPLSTCTSPGYSRQNYTLILCRELPSVCEPTCLPRVALLSCWRPFLASPHLRMSVCFPSLSRRSSLRFIAILYLSSGSLFSLFDESSSVLAPLLHLVHRSSLSMILVAFQALTWGKEVQKPDLNVFSSDLFSQTTRQTSKESPVFKLAGE